MEEVSNKSPHLSLNYQDVSINEIKFNSYVESPSATAKMDHSPQNQTLVFLGIEWDRLVGLVTLIVVFEFVVKLLSSLTLAGGY